MSVFYVMWFLASRFVTYLFLMGLFFFGGFYCLGMTFHQVPDWYALAWLLGVIFVLIPVAWVYTRYNIKILIGGAKDLTNATIKTWQEH